MADIRDPRVIYAKGILFLVLGGLASAILLFDHPSPKVAVLLAVAVWAFARAYYFAFYVIEHYIDPEFRFSGLVALAQYLTRKTRGCSEGRTPV